MTVMLLFLCGKNLIWLVVFNNVQGYNLSGKRFTVKRLLIYIIADGRRCEQQMEAF